MDDMHAELFLVLVGGMGLIVLTIIFNAIKSYQDKEAEAREAITMENYEGSPQYQAYLKGGGGGGLNTSSDNKKRKSSLQTKRGPKGGRYTEGKTKEGRPYRRYF